MCIHIHFDSAYVYITLRLHLSAGHAAIRSVIQRHRKQELGHEVLKNAPRGGDTRYSQVHVRHLDRCIKEILYMYEKT